MATLYDRTCYRVPKRESDQRASEGQPFVIRLKSPAAPMGFSDIALGQFRPNRKFQQRAQAQGVYDDSILIKSDGLPTYHLANVVDDHLMRLTHVIRGVEWAISTPKHLNLYQAFGWQPPEFCHLGLLLNTDGSKMSKRDLSFGLSALQEDGVLPEALVNFLVLYGWSHSEGSDFKPLKLLENQVRFSLSCN